MSTNTLATLLDRLSQRVGDYISVAVTTALTTSANVVSTNLKDYTNVDDTYNRFWLYVTDKANAGAYRKVSDYTAASGTCAVLGANFVTDSADLATVQIHRYDRNNKIRSLNQAARKVFPSLFRIVRNDDLITGNAVPNGRFTDWSVSTFPDYWRVTNATAAATTAAGLIRGGTKSALVTASAANGYMAVSSDQYPYLLDLMDRRISFKAWAYPSVANDATLVIYTLKADATAQTLTSTTTCPASKWTLLELEDQDINDDIQYIQFRLKLATNAATCYFANARVTDANINQYVLPLDFQNPLAGLQKVSIQAVSHADDPCDDLLAGALFKPLFGWNTEDDATTKYLILPTLPSEYAVRLEGIAPLESNMSAATDTMTIEDPHLDLLIEYAAHLLFEMEAGGTSGQTRDNLLSESLRYRVNYEDLRGRLKMSLPQSQTRFDPRIVRTYA